MMAQLMGLPVLSPERLKDLVDRSQVTVIDVNFYCSNGLCRKAPNAAKRARKMGDTDVKVMASGIKGWEATRLPTESGG